MEGVVIDNGASCCKAGLASANNAPTSVFPFVTAKRRTGGQTFVGDEIAQIGRDVLTLKYPIEHGIVTNWDDMETIWEYAFKSLQVNAEERSVVLTDVPVPRYALPYRKKAAEIMFERFKVPGLSTADQGVLSLLAANKKTGLVVNYGEMATSIVPIYEGCKITHAQASVHCGTLVDHLVKLLLHNIVSTAERRGLSDLIKNFGFVAIDPEYQSQIQHKVVEYHLPGKVLHIGNELYLMAESLFDQETGIPNAIHNAISECDKDIRNLLFENIVLSGGSTSLSGFENRITKELVLLEDPKTKINVIQSEDPQFSAWRGGAILASSPNFYQMSVSRADYEEFGPSAINCLSVY